MHGGNGDVRGIHTGDGGQRALVNQCNGQCFRAWRGRKLGNVPQGIQPEPRRLQVALRSLGEDKLGDKEILTALLKWAGARVRTSLPGTMPRTRFAA